MAQRRETKHTTCPGCGYQWHTLAVGRSATCRRCRVQHYVPADRTSAVPLADRPHREVTCRHCGHTWATRRPPQSAVPCSQCGAGVWVSRTAPVVESPAEVRRQVAAEVAAAELADRRAERAARRRHPAPRRPAPVSPAPAYAPQLGTLAALVADLAAALTAGPSPARPAPPPARRPGGGGVPDHGRPPALAPPAAPAPPRFTTSATPPADPYAVGPDTARVLAAIGQRDYLTPARPGDCPFYVVNRGAMCGLAAPYRVRLTPGAYLPACHGHAWSIRHQCAQFGVPFSAFPGLSVQ